MLQRYYTQNRLIKNPDEPLKNKKIVVKPGGACIDGFIDLAETESKHLGKNPDSFPQIIVAGFINLHCHLAYTNINLNSSPLFVWLSELVDVLTASKFDYEKSCLDGAKEAQSFGTSFLVDNTPHLEASMNAFKKTGLKGIIGLEVFGSDPDQAQNIFNKNLRLLDQHNFELCLSPHAPYDVSPALWKLCLDRTQSKDRSRPVLTHNAYLLSHVAESAAEEAWFRDKDSEKAKPAKDFWEKIGTLEPKLKYWKPYQGSVDFLNQNDLLNNDMQSILLTHLTQASIEDLKILRDKSISLVTCPRSNEYLHNGLLDINTWEKLGLNYGIGTDSKASNYDLDLRKEVNKLSEHFKSLTPKRKLELLTTAPAKILGKENEIGSLDIGKAADYTVFEIQNKDIDLDRVDVLELLFDTGVCKVKEVYINGEKCFHNE